MAISANHNKFVYSDYISPLPADFLLAAAEKKQQMYDEGRRQVSQTIDAYGSIRNSLVKPELQSYFDSVMNNYIKAVNQSAGLDFSVKANVDAVVGIGKPIQKDKVIINGVESSNNYRKSIEDFRKLKPEERGTSQDHFFQKEIQSWLQNPDLTAKLDYVQYTPYANIVNTAWGEVIKELKPITKQEFTQTPDGRYIITTKISEVDAQRVQEAYFAKIGETGMRQLQLDAQYKIETMGRDNVINEWKQKQNEYYQGLNLEITNRETKLNSAIKQYGQNDSRVKEYALEIEKLKQQRDVVAKRAVSSNDQINDNSLVNFIIQEDLQNVSNSYAYSETEQELDADKYALERYRSNLEMANYQSQKELDLLYDIEAEKYGVGKSRKEGKDLPPPPGAEETTAALKGQTVELQNFMDLQGGMTPEQRTNFLNGFAYLTGGKADPNTGEWKYGNLTMKEMLEKVGSENTWNSVDYKSVVTALGGASRAEQFFHKLKGIAGNLGVNIKDQFKSQGDSNVPPGKKVYTIDDEQKIISKDSKIVVNVKIPGTVPFSKTMSVSDFLNLPAYTLENVVSIDVKKDTLIPKK